MTHEAIDRFLHYYLVFWCVVGGIAAPWNGIAADRFPCDVVNGTAYHCGIWQD